MNVLEKLQNIFRDIFDDETIVLTRETSSNDIEDWDSLAQVNIIVACETEFDIKFNINEITALKNVGNIIDLVDKKL